MSREMKYSGIPWIGEIPKGWKVSRLKHLATDKDSLIIDGDWIESNVIEPSGIRYLTTGNVGDGVFKEQGQGYISRETFDALNCTMVYAGDLVFSRLNYPMGRSCIIPDAYERCVVAVDNVIFRPNKDVSKRYLMYVSMCTGFQNENALIARGATMQRMSRSQLVRVFVPIPDTVTQQKISSFLDRKCAEIDEMIALQEKIVEELKAYKQSVITEAVTKGLNPEVPMKDSGIDWIGEIPEHWQTVIFKSLFCIKKVIAGRLGYDVLSVTQQGLKVKDLSKNEGQVAQDYSKYQIVNIDDFVMNHMDLLTGYIDCATMPGVTSPDYRTFVNRNNEVADNNFFLQIFQKCYKDKTFYHLGQGVSFLGRWRLPKEQLNAFVLPLPPLNEQKEIANYLNDKCSEIDTLIKIKLSKIDSLKEYKKSIIYEYVTGKKEVTE